MTTKGARTTKVGEVAELWRYPVKSLAGERLGEATCSSRGLAGDRWWAVCGADGKLGSGKTTRRFRRMPGLLSISASIDDAGVTWVTGASGERARAADPRAAEIVGAAVGEPVTLAEESEVPHFDTAGLHVLSTASLEWMRTTRPDDVVEVRRFRPNVLVDVQVAGRSGRGGPEDLWSGRTVRFGTVEARITGGAGRCVMVTMSQPELGFAPGILRELARKTDGMLGVYGEVVEAGRIRVGDEVALVE